MGCGPYLLHAQEMMIATQAESAFLAQACANSSFKNVIYSCPSFVRPPHPLRMEGPETTNARLWEVTKEHHRIHIIFRTSFTLTGPPDDNDIDSF